MRMPRLYFYLLIPVALVFLSYCPQQENHTPVVKITSPANNAVFSSGAPIPYQVSVSDKEDGDSRYDEINVKEILLEVRYVKDKSKINTLIKGTVQDDPPGLAVMRSSNCFNCHDFSSKSIGPSFSDICKHYPVTKANTDSLVNRIKNGSSGLWPGKEKMPSHPELTAEQIRSTVQWIFKNASNAQVSYYNGSNGIIRIPQNKPGNYLVTASYTDHGIKNTSEKHLKGFDRVAITVK